MKLEPTDLLKKDLQKSGLIPEEIGAYPAQDTELAAVGIRPHMYLDTPGVHTPGYVIPYYDYEGRRAPFYRVKLFQPLPRGARYLQPSGTGSWVYFPRKFQAVLKDTREGNSSSCVNGFDPVLIICEGEKKAAKAVAEGFLSIALGGVYNWRTKTLTLPEDTKLHKDVNSGQIIARLSGNADSKVTIDRRAALANGFEKIIALLGDTNFQVVIAFDADHPFNPDVQKAASELALELRMRGIPTNRIRQLELGSPEQAEKIGLDDFLVLHGSKALQAILHKVLEARSAFPRHPDLKTYINDRLSGPLERSDAKKLSTLLLSDMDIDGIRMTEKGTGSPYFFDGRSKTLMRVNLLHHHQEPLHETKFGEYLYRTYDLSQADMRILTWLAAGFTGEQPVQEVMPRSVLAVLPRNKLAYQTDDGHFVTVTGDWEHPIKVCENGTEGILFRADQVEPIDRQMLVEEFRKQVTMIRNKNLRFEDMLWPKALSQFKFAKPTDHTVLSVLCYMSPWLLRWNGTQLPVELMIGEPGSGKSSMYGLRQMVLTGRPALRNQPTDVRDWYASITASDGMHVTDNVHFASKEIRQRLSDEICRIVTEPSPYVEMRRLFTTSENIRIPVRTTFALTAIQQPFINADILQRALIVELEAVGTNHASDWASSQLQGHGGRIVWLAHNLAVIHLFLVEATRNWDLEHKSDHRLTNFEQMFVMMGKIMGLENVAEVTKNLVSVSEDQVSEYDWTMEALKGYCEEHLPMMQRDPKLKITLQDVATWAMSREDFSDNSIATNSRRLARYIKSHHYMVEKCTGLFKLDGKYGNREVYRIKHIG